MSDLGPFAIRRIESRAASGAPVVAPSTTDSPAANVLKRAGEVFAGRVTGEIARGSAADAQAADAIRTQSSAIGAETLSPLLESLSSAAVLAADPATEPAADPMRASVFHPLANLSTPATPGPAGDTRPHAAAITTARATDHIGPLLDEYFKT